MEDRKKKEIAHYDKKADSLLREPGTQKWMGDFEGFHPHVLSSYRAFYKLLAQYCKGKKVLDYGCGNGIHSDFIARHAFEVVGIDLSERSLELARERMKKEGLEGKVSFQIMDCEALDFPDNTFDVVVDGGTFSSLDLEKAFGELARVLKPDGVVVGIETLGHNPVTNLKRKLNKKTGKRTEWATEHIFQMKDLGRAVRYFKEIEANFFHLFSWSLFPFLQMPGGRILLRAAEIVEYPFLSLPFLKTYSFKIVFVFRYPTYEKKAV